MTMTTHSATEKGSMVRNFGLVISLLIVLPTVARAQTETVIYFHTDAIGSVRMTTDASGQVIQRYDYAPFGEPLPAPTPETRRFAGGELDPETELNYFGARQYQPQTGRFSRSDDPGYGNPFNPQSMNFYAYASNNPLRWVDPTGHEAECPVIPGFTIDGCTEVTAPDRLAPYLPYLIQWLLEQRPNYPGGGGGGGGQGPRKPKGIVSEIFDTLKAPFEPGPPSCLGVALKAAADQLNPASPGIGDIGEMAGGAYAALKFNEALRYAGSTPSRTFGTPFLIYQNKSSVYRGLMKQAQKGGVVGFAASVTGAIWIGVYEEYQAAQAGLCR